MTNGNNLKIWRISPNNDEHVLFFVAESRIDALNEAQKYNPVLFSGGLHNPQSIDYIDASGLERGYLDPQTAEKLGI